MAKHSSKNSPRFQIEFRPSEQASAHGGQLAVHTLLEQFGLWEKIRQAAGLEVRTHQGEGYDPEIYVGQVVFCLISAPTGKA